jgi:hypothetical protein
MSADAIKTLQEQRPSRFVYHYTSAQGLIGIIKSKSLWASSMQYSNDRTELKHAVSLIRGLLDIHLKMERGPWNDLYGALIDAVSLFSDFHINVGSFSEEGDLLSQWRGYCPKAIGFSLGFDPGIIERQAKKQHFRLMKCLYEERLQRNICEAIIAEACIAANHEMDTEERKDTVVNGFIPLFLRRPPTLKNISFSEEKEWRVIGGPFAADDHQICFRAGTFAVIPYRTFLLADEGEPLRIAGHRRRSKPGVIAGEKFRQIPP